MEQTSSRERPAVVVRLSRTSPFIARVCIVSFREHGPSIGAHRPFLTARTGWHDMWEFSQLGPTQSWYTNEKMSVGRSMNSLGPEM